MKKQKNRNFEEVLEAIRSSESDVDRVLAAAKLERHERPSRRLSDDFIEELPFYIFGVGFMVFILLMFYMFR